MVPMVFLYKTAKFNVFIQKIQKSLAEVGRMYLQEFC